MSIGIDIILSFAVGLILMTLIGYLLLAPMKFFWRMAAGAVLGALILALINLTECFTGFSVAVNPFTSLTVGLLGVPGAILVCILTRLFL